MPIEFVDLEDARRRSGLRMVVVRGVPSPWGEAAKGILHVKGIPWVAVGLDANDGAMAEWTGQRSGPVAMYDGEPPRGGWAEILLLAERLAPEPALLPADAAERALAMGLAHEICGEMGLGWCRRLVGVHRGLTGTGPGFAEPVARYLGDKYGYRPEQAARYGPRTIELLEMLARRLSQGNGYYFASGLTAVDIYSAAFMAIFRPLPPEQCPMPEPFRQAFESLDEATAKALDPILLEHRDRIYRDHLELPLTL